MKNGMASIESFTRQRLPEHEWRRQKSVHEQRIDQLIGEYLERRAKQHKDPVLDFFFEYYVFRPSHLRKWSPGFGILLKGADENVDIELRELRIVTGTAFLDPDFFPDDRKDAVRWILTVLERSLGQKPAFGCFGMHEWAMVYKADQIRHSQMPLRMSPEKLAEFVESRPLVCTHFDAFRFFTEPAKPLNKFELSRAEFAATEQPGCIHTNMDLYKWAFKWYPWISSNTIRRAFELAVEARFIDMKASPYDLEARGLEPIRIETEEGRLEYVEKQKSVYRKSVPIRKQLIEEYRYLADYFEC